MAFPLTLGNPWRRKNGPFSTCSPPSAPSPHPVYHPPDPLPSAVKSKPKPKPRPKAGPQPVPPPPKAFNKPGSKPAPRPKQAGRHLRNPTPDPPPQRARRGTQPTISFAPSPVHGLHNPMPRLSSATDRPGSPPPFRGPLISAISPPHNRTHLPRLTFDICFAPLFPSPLTFLSPNPPPVLIPSSILYQRQPMMSQSSDSSLLERSTSTSRSDVPDRTTSSQDAPSDDRSRIPSARADRTELPMPQWASPYGLPLGHYPMPTMGYPSPPPSFPPAPIPASSSHGIPATASPWTVEQVHQAGKPRPAKPSTRPRTPAPKTTAERASGYQPPAAEAVQIF